MTADQEPVCQEPGCGHRENQHDRYGCRNDLGGCNSPSRAHHPFRPPQSPQEGSSEAAMRSFNRHRAAQHQPEPPTSDPVSNGERTMIETAQVLYEAYCAATDWKSLVSGAPLPQWVDMPREIQDAWRAVANAAEEMFLP